VLGARDLLDYLDKSAGSALERTVSWHHRRRLGRLGWSGALDPQETGTLWAQGDPAPHQGNQLDVLIDGAIALPTLAEALASAQEQVLITGWHLAPWFELKRGKTPIVLGELLAELAENIDVRVLLWAGAPIPAFHPTRREVSDAVRNLTRGTKIRCEVDPHEHPFHCHHEKTAIVDGQVAFVGGIDLTDLAGDRFDSPEHPARRKLGWHDVGTRLRGPGVKDVHEHFLMRWHELTGQRITSIAEPRQCGESTVQVVRTIADGMYASTPRGEFRILESYIRALRSARRLIYLENQFLWAPEIVSTLADKLRRPPDDRFRLIILLPMRANNGQDDTRGQLGVLTDADGGDQRLLAATIRSVSDKREDPLYVHAKVGIVDDSWMTVGSANLNAHSLFNDTEMNVVTDDSELITDVRTRLWSEHLQIPPSVLRDQDSTTLVDEQWRPIAESQLERQRAGAEPTHRLLSLPGVSRRSRRLLGPLEGLLDDG
jgi:phosphatidylserine/phosphatidylglycerophosphate/cardiolipin synthase-like enzyme